MKKVKLLMSLPMVLLFGCATIVKSPTQDLQIKTKPPGLITRVDGKQCTAPCTITGVSRREQYVNITIGNKDQKYKINKSFDFTLAILGNWWNLVLPGYLIDNASGAARDFNPTDITLSMYSHWAQRLSAQGDDMRTVADVSRMLMVPHLKCEQLKDDSSQCFWDVSAGTYSAGFNPFTYTASANNHFFRTACFVKAGILAGCVSDWREDE